MFSRMLDMMERNDEAEIKKIMRLGEQEQVKLMRAHNKELLKPAYAELYIHLRLKGYTDIQLS